MKNIRKTVRARTPNNLGLQSIVRKQGRKLFPICKTCSELPEKAEVFYN